MPARWFGREKWPVLIGYCRHVEAAGSIWLEYRDALEAGADSKTLTRLSKMHSRETDGVRHGARHLGLLVVNRQARRVPRYSVTPTLQPWEL
jgi:hypothetical protein